MRRRKRKRWRRKERPGIGRGGEKRKVILLLVRLIILPKWSGLQK